MKSIRFYFKSDYSLAYEQSYKTYIQSTISMRYVSSRNILYLGEIVETRGPYIILKIVKTTFNVTVGAISYTIPISAKLRNSVVVTYYRYLRPNCARHCK